MNRDKIDLSAHKEELLIDVERVIASKNPALLKYIPGFVVGFFKRLINQDEINKVIINNKDLKGVEFGEAVLKEFGATYSTIGLDNIPTEGRYIFAANHPLGGMDGIAFLCAVGQRFPSIKFPVNDILLNIKNLDNIFLPINKHGVRGGVHSRSAADLLNDAFASDGQVLFFPAGLVSRKQKGGIIKDLEWKKYFIKKAVQYRRDIVPVHIDGRNTELFYNLARWRKRLKIKSNFEMLLLPSEMFKQKGQNLTLRFGQPISWQEFANEKDATHSAEKVKEIVYGLPKKS